MKNLLLSACCLAAFALEAETYNLIGQRHLRLYTAPEPTQAYNAAVDAQRIADNLCNVPWRKVKPVNATSTSHVNEQLDANVASRDKFDAALFCAEHTNGQHRAYANAAVYRYRLPDGTLPNITRLSVRVSSDPYNDLGARVVLYANDTGDIPTDCATCRGDNPGGIRLAGLAPRITKIGADNKSYWYPNTTNAVFTQQFRLQRYLFVFVLMENYASSRGNWLEGCSYLENNRITLATDAPVPGWTDGATIDLTEPGYVASPDEWMPCFETTNTIITAVKDGAASEFAAPAWCFRRIHYGSTNLSSVTHSVSKFDNDVWERGAAVSNLVGWTVTKVLPNRRVAVTGHDVLVERGFEINPPSRGSTKSDADGDGIPDGWEIYVGSDPLDPSDATSDWDGDSLTLAEEYDAGYYPTDPWDASTLPNGLPDAAVYAYNIKGANSQRKDSDNDQLANYIEYLISGMDGFPVLWADRTMTAGEEFGGDQLVPDYFLRHGALYLGEMFADHDMIEDWWEDEQEMSSQLGSSAYSRYTYDANGDVDGDGWDNWSEARAQIAAGKAYGKSLYIGHPTPKGTIRITYNGMRAYAGTIVVRAFHYRNGAIPDLGYQPDATWTLMIDPLRDRDNEYTLDVPTAGIVRGGHNFFEVFHDADADGLWTPGEPYGIIGDVEVGYSKIADCSVELTDISPSLMRINLKAALNNNDFGQQVVLNDRGINSLYSTFQANKAVVLNTEFENPLLRSSSIRVRILRVDINETISFYNTAKRLTYYAGDVVFDGMVNSQFLTESTLAAFGNYDLDWTAGDAQNEIATLAQNLNITKAGVATIRYALLFGDEEYNPASDLSDNNLLKTTFVNMFEPANEQTKAVPTGIQNASAVNCPTFTWTHKNMINKKYPIFQLRVWRKSDNNLVYDSGLQRAGACGGEGKYGFTAPLHVGMTTPKGIVFDANVDYYYTVSMLDSKFRTPNTSETRCEFKMSAGRLFSDYVEVPVAVKYMGPAETSTNALLKAIHVEAFANPGFSGTPIAATLVKNTVTLAATNQVAVNALVGGVPRGCDFYLRAYIDTNGNGVRDVWESWGYGNYVGTDRKDVYTPYVYTARAKTADDGSVPTAVIYIEDCDTNHNKLPDAWEADNSSDGKTFTTYTGTTGQMTSPYIIEITPDGLAVATNILYVIDSGVANLPYCSALTKFANGGDISTLSLALAIGTNAVQSVD